MSERCFWPLLCAGLLFPLVLLGCSKTPPSSPETPTTPPEANGFDPTIAGIVRGQVVWEGQPPQVPRYEVVSNLPADGPLKVRPWCDNPNAPRIDPDSRGVGNAVVFLRGVAPRQARPWDHRPVRVEQRGQQLHIMQGDNATRVGFVRRGDGIELVSRDELFHALRATGAAFFTLAFPDPDQSIMRRLPEKGLVELTSAANCYWMRAYLFVDEHPYYARTDAQGRFLLQQVPPGQYQVVCWLPNWIKSRQDRDPETSLVTRLYLRPPVEQVRQLTLPRHGEATVNFAVRSAAFTSPP